MSDKSLWVQSWGLGYSLLSIVHLFLLWLKGSKRFGVVFCSTQQDRKHIPTIIRGVWPLSSPLLCVNDSTSFSTVFRADLSCNGMRFFCVTFSTVVWDKTSIFIQNVIGEMWILWKNEISKMWILWKMRILKCEFCEKWDFRIVNFVKNVISERWIL